MAEKGGSDSRSMSSMRALPELPRLNTDSKIVPPLPAAISTSSPKLSLSASTLPPWTPVGSLFGTSKLGSRPPRPISKDSPLNRPMTASTKRLSFSSWSSKRTIKYGTGKYAGVELVPQPSEEPEDPLVRCPLITKRYIYRRDRSADTPVQNWPTWKKHLNFVALLYMVALVGVMKTIYISVNSSLVLAYTTSYTAVGSLTGVPLMVSALTGLISLIVARLWGKRPVYLISLGFIFIGAMWNMCVASSYSQNMAARVFQGVGWGAFDALVLGSIQDTYFVSKIPPHSDAVAILTSLGT